MYMFTLSLKQASILLPFLLHLPLQVLSYEPAAPTPSYEPAPPTPSYEPAASTPTPSYEPAAPTTPVVPYRWSYTFHTYTGNIESGNFSFFILPGLYDSNYNTTKRSLGRPGETLDTLPAELPKRELDARLLRNRDSMNKRQLPLIPPNGQVWIWTQNDSGASSHGPFILECVQKQDVWQSYQPSTTGLKYILQVQSGHACTYDYDLDNLHARYGAQYVDVPTGMTHGNCVGHDNGVSCDSFTD